MGEREPRHEKESKIKTPEELLAGFRGVISEAERKGVESANINVEFFAEREEPSKVITTKKRKRFAIREVPHTEPNIKEYRFGRVQGKKGQEISKAHIAFEIEVLAGREIIKEMWWAYGATQIKGPIAVGFARHLLNDFRASVSRMPNPPEPQQGK